MRVCLSFHRVIHDHHDREARQEAGKLSSRAKAELKSDLQAVGREGEKEK